MGGVSLRALGGLAAFLSVAAVAWLTSTWLAPAAPPNIILIVTDDQHPAALGHMPVLSRLAEEGIHFRNAFTASPVCVPSRVSILTGQHPSTHGVKSNASAEERREDRTDIMAFDDRSSLATWLHDAGYRTGLFGKYLNRYQEISPHIPPGWDEWVVFVENHGLYFDYSLNVNGEVVGFGERPEDYSTDVLAGYALDFVGGDDGRPFFLMFAPAAPHDPSKPAPRHQSELLDLPPWRPPNWNEADVSDKSAWFRVLTAPVGEEGLAERTRGRIRQLQSLLAVDEAVAAMIAALDRAGIADETVLIFTADHGLGWGEHRWTGKRLPYEEAIRVPLVLYAPDRWRAPQSFDELVLNVDLAPTIAELARVRPALPVDGASLLSLIAGRSADWRSDFAVRHFPGAFLVPDWDALRTARFKYIRRGRNEELYDLDKDPFELESVAGDPAYDEIRRDLAARLAERLRSEDRPGS